MGFEMFFMRLVLQIGEAIVRPFLTEFNGVWFCKKMDMDTKVVVQTHSLKGLTN